MTDTAFGPSTPRTPRPSDPGRSRCGTSPGRGRRCRSPGRPARIPGGPGGVWTCAGRTDDRRPHVLPVQAPQIHHPRTGAPTFGAGQRRKPRPRLHARRLRVHHGQLPTHASMLMGRRRVRRNRCRRGSSSAAVGDMSASPGMGTGPAFRSGRQLPHAAAGGTALRCRTHSQCHHPSVATLRSGVLHRARTTAPSDIHETQHSRPAGAHPAPEDCYPPVGAYPRGAVGPGDLPRGRPLAACAARAGWLRCL